MKIALMIVMASSFIAGALADALFTPALTALALRCAPAAEAPAVPPAPAVQLPDRESACTLAAVWPTDGFLEACFREPVSLSAAGEGVAHGAGL